MISKIIQDTLRERNMTVSDLYRMTEGKIGRSVLYAIVAGSIKRPSFETIVRIRKALRLPESVFFEALSDKKYEEEE